MCTYVNINIYVCIYGAGHATVLCPRRTNLGRVSANLRLREACGEGVRE